MPRFPPDLQARIALLGLQLQRYPGLINVYIRSPEHGHIIHVGEVQIRDKRDGWRWSVSRPLKRDGTPKKRRTEYAHTQVAGLTALIDAWLQQQEYKR
jgi:hypothetical protein